MRKPRPQDVDPKYAKPTGPKPEKVDMTGVVAIKPKSKTGSERDNPSLDKPVRYARSTDRSTDRGADRSVNKIRSKNRVTRRYSFEAFDDQISELKKISISSALHGESIYISEMIRDAVDKFLKSRTGELNQIDRSTDRPNERSTEQ